MRPTAVLSLVLISFTFAVYTLSLPDMASQARSWTPSGCLGRKSISLEIFRLLLLMHVQRMPDLS